MDSRTLRVLAAAGFLFALAVALQLNGSSIDVWKDALRDDASPSGILFSNAKAVRSDEWMAWTPSILSQAMQRPSFPVENANLGAGKSPLLMSVPARHYAMLFRPQLYGFFIFDLETAFAFYWNAKFFALFLSFFFLLRVLTGNNFWLALFGTGWVCFSAYVQWWFSCPPMLPEMLASWATAILCVLHLFLTEKWWARIAAALLLVVVGVNFTLCFYPPFQIPLLYLGLAVVGGWLWQHQHAELRWNAGWIGLFMAGMGLAAVLIPYIMECRPTLELIAQTKYPGSRRSHGGDLTFMDAFNGILGFFNASERVYLGTRGNPCEASNFYPLWLFVLIGAGPSLWRDRRNRRIELVVIGSLFIFTLYVFCPFPAWFCRWTLLNYVTGMRALLAVGIAGVLVTTMLLAKPARLLNRSRRAVAAGAVFVQILALFALSFSGNETFLTWSRGSALLALNVAFIGLYFFAPQRIFCAVFLLALALNNGGINPIATGLGPLLEATPAASVREIRESDPGGKWVVFSNAWLPQFFKAQGVDVINGLQIVPDPTFYHELDPSGKADEIWNRYGFLVLHQGEAGQPPEFQPLGPAAYIVKVAPSNPVLRQRGVRYAVFPKALPAGTEAGMTLLKSFPENRIWIYKLPAS